MQSIANSTRARVRQWLRQWSREIFRACAAPVRELV